ncbi:MAG TPA: SPFH/Band 7/PHB domain protein, partial [Solirubrobacteraceae bacterium]|nr:SPFH/Band 7/PHB domain protein [Solirubrobacteraceae bacterium]
DTVFSAIHDGNPTRELLSYEYLQMLPQLAEGDANKVFVIPSEFAQAFGGIGETLAQRAGIGGPPPESPASESPASPPAGDGHGRPAPRPRKDA